MTSASGSEPGSRRPATRAGRSVKADLRRSWTMLIVSSLLVVGLFVTTIISGYRPQLGLDLQGGISVRLGAVGKFNSDSLDTAVNIIRNRVDALGVAEPEVSREGNDIVVDLPGVKNREQAERIVGRTAELRFRPVLAQLPALPETPTTTTTTSAAANTTTVPEPTTAPAGGPGKARRSQTEAPTTSTTAAAGLLSPEAAKLIIQSCDAAAVSAKASQLPDTAEEDDVADQCVLLPVRNGKEAPVLRLLLGKALLTGSDVETASPGFVPGTGPTVDMKLTGGGTDKFNKLASESYTKPAPQNQVAIALDGQVLSAPAFKTNNFAGGNVQISGSFTQAEARDLAQLIKFGALPVRLKQLTSVSVSPTLGRDQLHAGIVAGLVGLILVMLYVLVFYRILGLVIWYGLAMSGMLIWVVIAFLGQTAGLALTLAGVCGLIVSVGVTVDSYVVYFERLKDEARGGRTIRAAVDQGFVKSFRTIVAADSVSIIGAIVIYLLAEGGVRGFALFLLISTVLDLLVSYFVMHPMVSLMGHKPALVQARGIGIAAGLDAPEVKV